MGLFDFLKNVSKQLCKSEAQVDYDHLTEEGELPFGWLYLNKEFTEQIKREFTVFLHNWIEAKQQSPLELYNALNSFVQFLKSAGRLCESKGECFEYWFYSIITSKDYIEKRENELIELSVNRFELQEIYEKKQHLFPAVIDLLKANDGILQSDFKKLFDEPFQNEVSDILYHLHKEGKLERIKSGRTYILHFRG